MEKKTIQVTAWFTFQVPADVDLDELFINLPNGIELRTMNGGVVSTVVEQYETVAGEFVG